MRGMGLIAVGVMSLGMLVGCGGTLEEASSPGTGDETEALLACPIDRPCPGTTTCVDGLCRDCKVQPQFCRVSGSIPDGETRTPTKAPGNPGPGYCWKITGTSCSQPGALIPCTDGTFSDYTCTCGTDYRYYCQQTR